MLSLLFPPVAHLRIARRLLLKWSEVVAGAAEQTGKDATIARLMGR